jgi:hypothetical protein
MCPLLNRKALILSGHFPLSMLLSAMPCFKLSPSGLPQLDGLNSWFSWPYYEIPIL